jgi:hypothetical protein
MDSLVAWDAPYLNMSGGKIHLLFLPAIPPHPTPGPFIADQLEPLRIMLVLTGNTCMIMMHAGTNPSRGGPLRNHTIS